jgi:hypothetical protein
MGGEDTYVSGWTFTHGITKKPMRVVLVAYSRKAQKKVAYCLDISDKRKCRAWLEAFDRLPTEKAKEAKIKRDCAPISLEEVQKYMREEADPEDDVEREESSEDDGVSGGGSPLRPLSESEMSEQYEGSDSD